MKMLASGLPTLQPAAERVGNTKHIGSIRTIKTPNDGGRSVQEYGARAVERVDRGTPQLNKSSVCIGTSGAVDEILWLVPALF
jgi:hypothetical protein